MLHIYIKSFYFHSQFFFLFVVHCCVTLKAVANFIAIFVYGPHVHDGATGSQVVRDRAHCLMDKFGREIIFVCDVNHNQSGDVRRRATILISDSNLKVVRMVRIRCVIVQYSRIINKKRKT